MASERHFGAQENLFQTGGELRKVPDPSEEVSFAVKFRIPISLSIIRRFLFPGKPASRDPAFTGSDDRLLKGRLPEPIRRFLLDWDDKKHQSACERTMPESRVVIEQEMKGVSFMSVQLLDKTRKINKLLHNTSSSKVVFNDICKVMVETLSANIMVISRKGKVLGFGKCDGCEVIDELLTDKVGEFIDPLLNERFLGVLSTKENVNLATVGFTGEKINQYMAIINPIDIAGERLGTVFGYRQGSFFDIEDIIVSEYGTTVVGLEMMRSVDEENAEESRRRQIVKSAFSTLSFSELEAIIHIFAELDGKEGILVASKIADRVGITRSVIVNALRKFESAGIIESRSSGMKGTYIKVLNDYIFEELDEIKARREEK